MFPFASLIIPLVIVLVLVPFAVIEAGLGVRVIVPAGNPGLKVTVVLPEAVPPDALTVAVPATVPAFRVNIIIPLDVAAEVGVTVPKVVETLINVPSETVLPCASLIVPLVIVLVLDPSARIEVGTAVRVIVPAGAPGLNAIVVLPEAVPP